MKKTLAIVFMVLLTGIFLTGCMISQRSHTSNSSPDFALTKAQLNSVEPGVTTKEWIIENFGEPKRDRYLSDGEEILVYENTKHTSSHVGFFLIFNSHTSEDTTEAITFRIKDGIVKSYSVG